MTSYQSPSSTSTSNRNKLPHKLVLPSTVFDFWHALSSFLAACHLNRLRAWVLDHGSVANACSSQKHNCNTYLGWWKLTNISRHVVIPVSKIESRTQHTVNQLSQTRRLPNKLATSNTVSFASKSKIGSVALACSREFRNSSCPSIVVLLTAPCRGSIAKHIASIDLRRRLGRKRCLS